MTNFRIISVPLTFVALVILMWVVKNVESKKKSEEITKTYMAITNSECVGKCQWKMISAEVMSFTGEIKPGSELEFFKKMNPNIKQIELNSGGGYVRIAIAIAEEIKRRNLNVRVSGFCISSCANYLFLAGNIKYLNGVLGFHGSGGASSKERCRQEPDLKICEEDQKEQALFRAVGVSNALFEITQSKDKGMNDDKAYRFYAPSVSVLKQLGVKQVIGEQNYALIQYLRDNSPDEFEYLIATDPNPAIQKFLESK